MTNTLVQELCRHITRLEAENQNLQATLSKHHTLFQQLCDAAGCQNWSSFVDWSLTYFRDPQNRLNYQPLPNSNSRSCSIERLSKELFSETDLPSIQEQLEQTSSRNSIRTNGQIDCNELLVETAKWANETLKLSEARHMHQQETLTTIDYIIIENGDLRRQNSKLTKQLTKAREIIQSLMFIVKSSEEPSAGRMSSSRVW